ncbi:MAG: D-glycerate dehydrogenase [Pseudomonadota bacterium]
MVRPSILVTHRLPRAVERKLAANYEVEVNRADRPLSPAEFRAAIQKYDAVLPTDADRISAEALDVPRAQTRILANYGNVLDHIDLACAKTHGMAVTNTPDVLSECTADLAMTLLLTAARRTSEGERELRAGLWDGWKPTHLVGTKVSGKTLGIVGFGRVGQEMAQRAHFGFGMDAVVFDPAPVADATLARFNARRAASLNELLPLCDFVSLHCAGGAETVRMFSGPQFDMMKPEAFLINTSSGAVIDEAALAQALMFDVIGGAALDVFAREPRIDPMLTQCDNLVMLPHMGSATEEARQAMGFRVIDNLKDFFDGKAPRDRVA